MILHQLNWIIGIDPDVDKNGVALLDVDARSLALQSLSFPDLLDYLLYAKRCSEVAQKHLRIVIEAGWLNKAHWHIHYKDTKQSAAAKGNAAGRNHEVGRKIAEMCKHYQIDHVLVKPLQLTVGGTHLWEGKDGKITHKELSAFTNIQQTRTNQEERDAALISWVYAGFPTRIVPK